MLKIFVKAIGWTIVDIVGISSGICTYKSVKHQRRLNPPMKEVVKKDIIKWLDVGVIYSIANSD